MVPVPVEIETKVVLFVVVGSLLMLAILSAMHLLNKTISEEVEWGVVMRRDRDEDVSFQC